MDVLLYRQAVHPHFPVGLYIASSYMLSDSTPFISTRPLLSAWNHISLISSSV